MFEIQLEVVPGVYSGIFALYLQFVKSKTVVYYVLCLLYILSAATVVCDFLAYMFSIYQYVSNNSIGNLKNIVFYHLCRMHYRFNFTMT